MLKKRARPELQELNMHSPVMKLTVSGIPVVLAGCTPLGLNPSNAGSPRSRESSGLPVRHR